MMTYVNIVRLDGNEFKGRLAGRIIHIMSGRLNIFLADPEYRYHGRKFESDRWEQVTDQLLSDIRNR